MNDMTKKMPKPKLDSKVVSTCSEPGKYYDTLRNGLMLSVRKNGRKYWVQRFSFKGKMRDVGLGTFPEISLSEARQKAAKNQVRAREGIDPYPKRPKAKKPANDSTKAAAAATKAVAFPRNERGIPSFEEVAHERYAKLKLTFKNPEKDGPRWFNTLASHSFPHIGSMAVDEIKPRHIEDLLMADDLWLVKCDTARRVMHRIGNIMRYAVMRGYRNDDPTAALKGVMVPQKKKKTPMRSLPYAEVPAAMEVIRNKPGWPPVRLGLEFQALTAVRPGEARLARRSEIDFEARTWTIPAERMKMGRQLIVPLSDQAMRVLAEAEEYWDRDDDDALIFPSPDYSRAKPLTDMAFSKAMRDMKIDAVPHGFRSSFRTWTQEQTNARDKVAEAALGHLNPNQVEGAYARSDYLDQRRNLMQLWGDFLDGKDFGEEVKIERVRNVPEGE